MDYEDPILAINAIKLSFCRGVLHTPAYQDQWYRTYL